MKVRNSLSAALGLIIAEVIFFFVFILIFAIILALSGGNTADITGNILYKTVPSLLTFSIFLNLARFNQYFKISIYFRTVHILLYFLNLFTSEAYNFDFYSGTTLFCIPLVIETALSVLIEIFFFKGMINVFKNLDDTKYIKAWKELMVSFSVFYIIYSLFSILSNFYDMLSVLTSIFTIPCAIVSFVQFIYLIKSFIQLRKIEKSS